MVPESEHASWDNVCAHLCDRWHHLRGRRIGFPRWSRGRHHQLVQLQPYHEQHRRDNRHTEGHRRDAGVGLQRTDVGDGRRSSRAQSIERSGYIRPWYEQLDNWFPGSGVRDCAAQFPHRHRRYDQDLVGGRLRSYDSDRFDGNLLQRRGNSNTNTNRNG